MPLAQLIAYSHTFTIVSLLLALMLDLCLPLSAGKDTFELHSVQLELEDVERRIHRLLGKQAQLRKRKATLETSRADNVESAAAVATVVIHAGVNDTKLRLTETLKRDFRILIETVHSTSPETTIIVSGPLPTYRLGHERFSRTVCFNRMLVVMV